MISHPWQAELNNDRWLKCTSEAHDPDVCCFQNMGDSQRLAILDIGAYRGQSIISFKAVLPDARIGAVEASAFFGPVLVKVAMSYDAVDVFNVGLGRATERAVLRVPVVDGRYYWEEGSIRPDSFENHWAKSRLAGSGAELRFQKYAVEIPWFDSMLRVACADIVKICAEGAELEECINLLTCLRTTMGRMPRSCGMSRRRESS